jgi:hypothetical protein
MPRARSGEYGLAVVPTEPDEILRRAMESVTPENGPSVPDRLTDEAPSIDDTDQEGDW